MNVLYEEGVEPVTQSDFDSARLIIQEYQETGIQDKEYDWAMDVLDRMGVDPKEIIG